MTMTMRGIASLLLLCMWSVQAFTTTTTTTTTTATASIIGRSTGILSSTASDESATATTTTDKGMLKRDRYVATNRFAVRKDKAAKFEKRWATRKSRLASLDGFKYFHLMRRVTLEDDGTNTYDEGGGSDSDSDSELQGNYVSFTIWEKKSDFSAWRSGEAFKEAHGGTSIGAFVSTMVSSAMVLKGAPRPAFYDGLLVQSTPVSPESLPTTVDGWRSVDADGVNTLPTECFVACNQFYVPLDNAAAFEQRWASRESKLSDCEGFCAFSMLRRDGQAKGHGVVKMDSNTEPTYLSTTIWKNRASFDKWREGTAFQHAHGQQQQQQKKPSTDSKESASSAAAPPKPLWSQPPQPIFYEGTLVITSEVGV